MIDYDRHSSIIRKPVNLRSLFNNENKFFPPWDSSYLKVLFRHRLRQTWFVFLSGLDGKHIDIVFISQGWLTFFRWSAVDMTLGISVNFSGTGSNSFPQNYLSEWRCYGSVQDAVPDLLPTGTYFWLIHQNIGSLQYRIGKQPNWNKCFIFLSQLRGFIFELGHVGCFSIRSKTIHIQANSVCSCVNDWIKILSGSMPDAIKLKMPFQVASLKQICIIWHLSSHGNLQCRKTFDIPFAYWPNSEQLQNNGQNANIL